MTQTVGGKPKRTRREAENIYYVNEALQRLEYDLHTHLNHMRRIPLEWEQIYTDRSYHKTRITMRVDQDVLKFFRSLGPGYQPRMNDVLRAFMHAKLAGLIGGGETMTEYRENRWADRNRPQFGDVEKQMGARRGG
ncbi:BrnA antitoxin family protein [Sedimentitalea sp. JM2-8]|uniref:BrnA antitoxin family protein n=1 Tax=Sedimentitalea xiamensis TaxID=3050037 RepID=A0ABT7FDL6_9RHOB|nr:BrnA antitoxin family protein [Sedimentitalea xiamensis]MDK3073209.1 BrnA antitoxin family protein [Sedimentitalea xiamensis]